jgi:hypothetical protein
MVMPGLVTGFHDFPATSKGVDGRDKPGHDEVIGHRSRRTRT